MTMVVATEVAATRSAMTMVVATAETATATAAVGVRVAA